MYVAEIQIGCGRDRDLSNAFLRYQPLVCSMTKSVAITVSPLEEYLRTDSLLLSSFAIGEHGSLSHCSANKWTKACGVGDSRSRVGEVVSRDKIRLSIHYKHTAQSRD